MGSQTDVHSQLILPHETDRKLTSTVTKWETDQLEKFNKQAENANRSHMQDGTKEYMAGKLMMIVTLL